MTKQDHELLEELYANSKIKQAIKKLLKEGKSKDQIEKILFESKSVQQQATSQVPEKKEIKASAEGRIHKKDYVLMESAYEQVLSKK
jgi:hypothetical protein